MIAGKGPVPCGFQRIPDSLSLPLGKVTTWKLRFHSPFAGEIPRSTFVLTLPFCPNAHGLSRAEPTVPRAIRKQRIDFPDIDKVPAGRAFCQGRISSGLV